MEGVPHNEVPKPKIDIREDEHGNFSAYELGDSIIREGTEIIESDPVVLDMVRARASIQAPDARQKMFETLLNTLNTKYPEFNWKTYFELVDNTSPTRH